MTSVRAPLLFSFALPMRLLCAESATRRYLHLIPRFCFDFIWNDEKTSLVQMDVCLVCIYGFSFFFFGDFYGKSVLYLLGECEVV